MQHVQMIVTFLQSEQYKEALSDAGEFLKTCMKMSAKCAWQNAGVVVSSVMQQFSDPSQTQTTEIIKKLEPTMTATIKMATSKLTAGAKTLSLQTSVHKKQYRNFADCSPYAGQFWARLSRSGCVQDVFRTRSSHRGR